MTPARHLVRRRSRLAYAVVSGLFALAILVQVFLAGSGLFAGASWWPMHEAFGMMLVFGPLALLIVGIVARLPWPALAVTALLLALTVLQPFLITIPRSLGVPLLAALHPVNAVVLFGLALLLGQQALRPRASTSGGR